MQVSKLVFEEVPIKYSDIAADLNKDAAQLQIKGKNTDSAGEEAIGYAIGITMNNLRNYAQKRYKKGRFCKRIDF